MLPHAFRYTLVGAVVSTCIVTDFGLLQEQEKVVQIYIIKERGQRTEPCGTPKTVSFQSMR